MPGIARRMYGRWNVKLELGSEDYLEVEVRYCKQCLIIKSPYVSGGCQNSVLSDKKSYHCPSQGNVPCGDGRVERD